MTGRAVVSRYLASRTQMYDLQVDDWSPEILELADLTPERLAEVQPSGFAVDRMSGQSSPSLGLASPPYAYDLRLAHASEEPSNLLLLPHFAGNGTPWFDTT